MREGSSRLTNACIHLLLVNDETIGNFSYSEIPSKDLSIKEVKSTLVSQAGSNLLLMRVPGKNDEILFMEYVAPAIVSTGGIWDSLSVKFPM